VVNSTSRPLYPSEWHGTHYTGGWLGPTTNFDGRRKSRSSTGIRSPNRPACRKSLYRLSYPGPQTGGILQVNLNLANMRGGCAPSRTGRPAHRSSVWLLLLLPAIGPRLLGVPAKLFRLTDTRINKLCGVLMCRLLIGSGCIVIRLTTPVPRTHP